MSALRFFILGYFAGSVAGLIVGAFEGAAAGWLTAWLGGGAFSVAFAGIWWTARRRAEARRSGPAEPSQAAPERDAV